MKILIIHYRYFISSGPERYLFDIKKKLEEEGHEVIPFSIKSKSNLPTHFEKYFAEPMGGQDEHYYKNLKKTPRMVVDVISRLFYSFHVKKRLNKLIKLTRPDVAYILILYNKLSPSVIDSCKKFNIPTHIRLSDYFLVCPEQHLFNGKNQLCEDCINKSYLSCTVNKCINDSIIASFLKSLALIFHTKILNVYSKVDALICTNPFMKEKLLEKGFPEDKTHVITTFKQKKETTPINPPDLSENYILFFGRFKDIKAIDTLVYAYLKSELYKRDTYLYLIGGNLDELKLNLDVEQRKIFKKNVKVFSFLNENEVFEYIKNSLFVVNPSRIYENFPNAILEAFAFNKAVITTNIGSLSYMVDNSIGLHYEYENIDDLAKKMIMLTDDDLRRSKEANIPNHFKKYSIELHYKKLIELFTNKLTNND